MKPVDVKASTFIDFDVEINDKDVKFKDDDRVRISKYKNSFTKTYPPNCSEEFFVIKKVKNTSAKRFAKPKSNRVQSKEIKKKGDKLYVKQKGCDDSLNSWIYKKDIVQNELLP